MKILQYYHNILKPHRMRLGDLLFAFTGFFLVFQFVTPMFTDASPTLDEYPITSGYVGPIGITTTPGADGSMWYTQDNTSTGYDDHIGNISTSGSVTDYNIVPSGYTWASANYLTTGSDGNVWFSGCADNGSAEYMTLGILNVSTGSVSLTPFDTGATGCSTYWVGPVAIDDNGNAWVIVHSEVGRDSLVRFDSSGAYSYSWQESSGEQEWNSLSAGPDNTLWLTDQTNNQLDKLTLSPSTYDVTATDSYTVPTSYSTPESVTLGPDGNMWFVEGSTDKIGTVTSSGTFTEYTIPSGGEATAITTGPDGALWFTDYGGNDIGRITTGGSITEYSIPTTNSYPMGITAGPDNALWFTEDGSAKIGRISAEPFVNEYPITSGYVGPIGITTTPGADGSMWYTQDNTSTGYDDHIGNISTSGSVTDYNIVPSGYTWASANYLTTGSDGNVWFSGCADNGSAEYMTLGILNVSTGSVSLTPFDTGATGCSTYWVGPVAIDDNGNAWVIVHSEVGRDSLVRFDSSGAYSYSWQESSGEQEWNSLSAGPDNTLWLTDQTNNQLDKLTLSPSTYDVTATDSYTVPTSYSTPESVTLGPDGNMWFVEGSTDKIGTVTSSGTFTEYTIPSGGEATAITTGPDGALWFTDYGGNDIGRITTGGSITEYSIPTTNSYPMGITAGPDNALWFTEDGSAKIGRIGY